MGAFVLLSCNEKGELIHTHVFGTGGGVGPALSAFTAFLPSEYGSITPPAGLDTLKYESAFFKVLVDGQEYSEADVKVGDVSLRYSSDNGLYMALDDSGNPVRVNLSAGTSVSIYVPKYDERVQFSLPEVNPPDTVLVDTPIHTVGDSIRISWSPVSGADSVQVFFKLADKDPHVKNLPPTDTVYFVPASEVDTTGVATVMVNALKLVGISSAQKPSFMVLLKGKALPPITVQQ